jgi:UDP:flavonoid glycosyltransferase YjiC (YdhE family)
VRQVLNDTRYADRARELQRGFQASGGLRQAADIVEAAQRSYAS